ncbi:MAG: hypothetical protein JO113_01220 [Candidatus Eremiobacteraeota bacterium]|nr:hypothetical protein [Candidatus Eremiobacteraeota bacterium]
MKAFEFLGTTLIASLCALTAIARADAPLGTLVYHFSYSANQNITARDSANPAQGYGAPDSSTMGNAPSSNQTGISHYAGSLNDKGTMTVEIVKKQPDGGLVVLISEQGENIRRAPPAECVVYGNTNVICDPNKTVYTEEYTLLRFLAGNFVDPSQLDASKHWKIVQDVNNDHVSADYTIDSNNNGAMQIGETRTIKETGAGHLETDVQTKIGYDYTRLVPTSIDEYAQQYSDAGIKGSQRTIYQTTLQLLTDTTAKT